MVLSFPPRNDRLPKPRCPGAFATMIVDGECLASQYLRPAARWARHALMLAVIAALAGCAIAKPRTDDPLQKFNRKSYAVNHAIDKAVIRPVAVVYRKVTNPPVRRAFSDFFSNIQLPVTIANDLLQAQPKRAIKSTGRFLVNLTVGLGGFMDPASRLGMPQENNDFGITLARWGVPDGAYLVIPLIGPTTTRDIWRMPVDGYFFDPLSIYARTHDFTYKQEFIPQILYLVTLRSRGIDAESYLESAYDPYIFVRDAYRQQRLYELYDGSPPDAVIEQLQGVDDKSFDPDKLLQEQHAYEKKHHTQAQPSTPASSSSSGGS